MQFIPLVCQLVNWIILSLVHQSSSMFEVNLVCFLGKSFQFPIGLCLTQDVLPASHWDKFKKGHVLICSYLQFYHTTWSWSYPILTLQQLGRQQWRQRKKRLNLKALKQKGGHLVQFSNPIVGTNSISLCFMDFPTATTTTPLWLCILILIFSKCFS